MNRWREIAEAVPLPVWLASGLALLALVVGVLLPGPEPSAPQDDITAQAPPSERELSLTEPARRPAPQPQGGVPERREPVAQPVAPSPPPVRRPPERAAPVAPEPPPLEGFALPTLDQSDSFTRAQLVALVGEAPLSRWLVTDQFLRRFVAIAANAAKGKVLRRQFPFVRLDAPFPVIERNGQLYMDSVGHRRYDRLVTVIVAIDSDALAVLLRRLSPLLEVAYRELGYPQGNISQVLRSGLQQVIKAPVTEREIRLVRPSVMYRFADPELEHRSLIDRQLLRMGPANTRKLQRQAKELLEAL